MLKEAFISHLLYFLLDVWTASCMAVCNAGALMAVEYINRDSSILGDYQLDLLVEDTECKVDIAMKHFLHYAVDGEHPVAGILGK